MCVCVKINEGATSDTNNMVAVAMTVAATMMMMVVVVVSVQFRQMHTYFNGKI